MPAVAGLLFAPMLVVALAVLARTPPPDARDRAERGERVAMDRSARHACLRAHAIPLAALVTGYTILASLRDFRDNIAAELCGELGNGSVALLLLRELEDRSHWLGFFTTAPLMTGTVLAAATLVSGSWFFAQYVRRIG